MQLSHQKDGNKGQLMNIIKEPIFMKHDLKYNPISLQHRRDGELSIFQTYKNISFKQNYVKV